MTDADILATPIGFASEILGLKLYDWQDKALSWFENAVGGRVKASLCTPNGAGKDSIVIASLALWWVSVHKRGRVVITSKDARQIDEQTWPALERHRSKFQDWKWIEREISTPTGGKIILFTTTDHGRAEGFHRETGEDGLPNNYGPVLLIINEAKSVEEGIFTAFDRCTYDALLYASSPGPMSGRFYESQFKPELGFKTLRIGLKDCPHIPKERIDDIRATYGADSAFARSTLDGEFMPAEGEARFDTDGIKDLVAIAEAQRDLPDTDPNKAEIGYLQEQEGAGPGHHVTTWTKDPAGWIWMIERPIPGCSYVGFCDPMTGEQSEGSLKRDTHAAGIIRQAYEDAKGVWHDDEVVAVCHAVETDDKDRAACRWDNDILADRFALLVRYYANCLTIVEANNAGNEVMRLLQQHGVHLWRREKPNHRVPGKKFIDVVGFQTTSASKGLWIGALGTAIRERTLVCRYLPAVNHFATFILNENGHGEAQDGCNDDFVTGVGMGLLIVRTGATRLPLPAPVRPVQDWIMRPNAHAHGQQQPKRHGAVL